MNPIIEKFRDKAIERSGLFLFSGTDALRVIEEARLRHLAILGIDGIFIIGNKTQPSLEDSVDFTLGSDRDVDIHDAAIDFVKRHENLGLYFEIVFGSENGTF